jgi:hypothetical protein
MPAETWVGETRDAVSPETADKRKAIKQKTALAFDDGGHGDTRFPSAYS